MNAHTENAGPLQSDVRWSFGSFVVWEGQRRIERSGCPVRIGSRSFDLLLQLLMRAGEFVSKDELLGAVWAGLVVEEGSVRVHMSALRKALGEGEACEEWISSAPHRGYRFNGRVRRLPTEVAERVPDDPTQTFAELPGRLTDLVGREADISRILSALGSHRLVTVVGTGGIGKTSAAIRAVECHQGQGPDTAVAFADLSSIASQDDVLGTIASALGLSVSAPRPVEAILKMLQGRSVLLLVDNCEHVVEVLVPALLCMLTGLPRLQILATSREPLRVAGEYVLRLSPLAIPDAEAMDLTQAMRWPAVQLLVERATSAGAGPFHEAHGSLLARMARQLDGIPLAIELVAARLGVQPIGDLAARLDDHTRLHTAGSRSANPRHRTLAAALEWNIDLLPKEELQLLRRLSVFRGRFDIEAALRVNADAGAEATFNALISLANKSLVAFDTSESAAPYRLLETTRSYAATLQDEDCPQGPA